MVILSIKYISKWFWKYIWAFVIFCYYHHCRCWLSEAQCFQPGRFISWIIASRDYMSRERRVFHFTCRIRQHAVRVRKKRGCVLSDFIDLGWKELWWISRVWMAGVCGVLFHEEDCEMWPLIAESVLMWPRERKDFCTVWKGYKVQYKAL